MPYSAGMFNSTTGQPTAAANPGMRWANTGSGWTQVDVNAPPLPGEQNAAQNVQSNEWLSRNAGLAPGDVPANDPNPSNWQFNQGSTMPGQAPPTDQQQSILGTPQPAGGDQSPVNKNNQPVNAGGEGGVLGAPTAGQQPGQHYDRPTSGPGTYYGTGADRNIAGGPVDYGNARQNDPTYGLNHQLDEEGNEFGPAGIGSVELGAPPQISEMFSPEMRAQYFDDMNQMTDRIGSEYNYATPQMEAAQMQLNQPGFQQSTQQQAISPELQRMLSGQGYNPAVFAQMRARAGEDVGQAGLTEMSQAKRALGQAGLAGSPAAAGIASDVARRSGDARTSAMRDIDISNAQTGMENARFGVGQQSQIGMNNMQQANQMAMQNANRMFSAMNQNAQNIQQANQFNTGNESQRRGNQAGATSEYLGQRGNAYGDASLNRAGQSAQTNAQNQMTTNMTNAQLERQRQQQNSQNLENRWQTSMGQIGNFSQPETFGQPGPQSSPTGETLEDVGGALGALRPDEDERLSY